MVKRRKMCILQYIAQYNIFILFFHFGLDSNFIHASDLRIIEMVATVLSDSAAQLQGNKENLSMN